MKTMLLLFSLVLFSGFKSVNATSIISAQTADFYRIDYPSVSGEKFVSGTVTLDYIRGSINVLLVGKNNCPPNAFCIRGPITARLTATMVSRERLSCGQNVYKAEKNDLAVDGYDVSIKVSDMTHLVCRMRPMAPTIVEITKRYFDHIKGEEVVQRGLLFAHPLRVTGSVN